MTLNSSSTPGEHNDAAPQEHTHAFERYGASPSAVTVPFGAFQRRFVPRIDLMETRTLLSTLTVSTANDNGPGSLRATIAAATSGDTIDFSSKLSGLTIKLTSGELALGASLNIDGPVPASSPSAAAMPAAYSKSRPA